MLEIYKKCEKTPTNPYGYTKVEEQERPFILCISAQDNHDKSIFGMMSIGVQAARCATSEDPGALYKMEDMPVDFLGMRFQKDEAERATIDGLSNDFIYPFLTKGGLDKESLIHQAKLMNFVTYCDGTRTYFYLEKDLERKLATAGISSEDISDILGNIGVVAIGTLVDTDPLKATIATFVDVDDSEISTKSTIKIAEKLGEAGRRSIVLKSKDFSKTHLFYTGTGEHSVKEYLDDYSLPKPGICAAVKTCIDKSTNKLEKPFQESFFRSIITNTLENEEMVKSKLKEIDQTLDYECSKYTPEEYELRKMLNETILAKTKAESDLERTKQSLSDSRKEISDLQASIRAHASEVGALQILVGGGHWQVGSDKQAYLTMPSDKEVREKANSAGLINDGIKVK